jgi:GNAT superfamily N-acetyltransferase
MDYPAKHITISVEQAALASVHEIATAEQKKSLGLALYERGGSTVSVCRAEQGIMLNRSVGLGVFEPADEGLVDWTISRFRENSIYRAFIAASDGSRSANLVELLATRGLEEARAWAKFARAPEPAPTRETDLRIAALDHSHAGHWGRIVAAAFDMPTSTAPLLAQLIDHPGWHLFMSFAGDEPAGAAGMFVHGGIAWFDWAATDPAFRRRGSQGALMRVRIETAIKLGCSHLVTTTGEAVPGDPQHSWGNIGRYGFEPVYRARNFVVSSV